MTFDLSSEHVQLIADWYQAAAATPCTIWDDIRPKAARHNKRVVELLNMLGIPLTEHDRDCLKRIDRQIGSVEVDILQS